MMSVKTGRSHLDHGLEEPGCSSRWQQNLVHLHDASFTGMQNTRVTGWWKLPPRVQRKACENRQWPAGCGSCRQPPGGYPRRCENELKTEMEIPICWRCQKHGASAAGLVEPAPQRVCVSHKQQSHNVGLPKPISAQIVLPHALDVRHGASGFNVCPDGFQSYFEPILHFSALISLFSGTVMITVCNCIVEGNHLFVIFAGVHSWVYTESQKRLWTYTFE